MRSALLDRLLKQESVGLLETATLDEMLQQPGHVMLFCSGDPLQRPEANDLAVILPELHAAFQGQFSLVVVDESAEAEIQSRFGIQQWPSLVLLRDGEYVGTISRLRDWSVYLQELRSLLQSESKRPPTIGIPVVKQA